MDQFIPMPKPKPSTLLIVLCVLSILSGLFRIGSASMSLKDLDKITALKPEVEKAQQEAAERRAANPNKKGSNLEASIQQEAAMLTNPDYIKKNAYISIVTAIITLLGAILMLRLNSVGFWVYVAGVIAEVAAPLVLFGAGLFTGINMAVNGFFGLIFIVLYAFCLKEMKPAPVIQD